MKILQIINNLEMGGAQKFLTDLIPMMAERKDIEITVAIIQGNAAPTFIKILEDAGVRILNLNTSPKSIKTIFKLIPLIRQSQLVHVHLFAANYLVAMANLFVGRPLIFTEHSTHNRRRNYKFLQPIEKFIYKRYNVVACISEGTKTALSNWIGQTLRTPLLTTITNGIDIEKYKNAPKSTSEEKFGRKGIPILMISRFVESKNHATVIKALSLIENPNVFVVFVGDGPLKGQCEQLTNELGLAHRVLFLGERSDVSEIIKASYIGVQSSNWEGFGLTAIEMMAGGIPVIASDVEGLSQVVGEAGLLFYPGNEIDLKIQINKLLNDVSLHAYYVKMGNKCVEKYSITESVNQYIELYHSQL